MKNLKNLGKVLGKKEQKEIEGGVEYPVAKGDSIILNPALAGVTYPGNSQYCWSRPAGYHVMINGSEAVCTGNGGEYWFL